MLEQCSVLGWSCRVEKNNGFFLNRNIVVGDIKKARFIFSAHYDTCAWMPVPNFITPKNIPLYLLYQFILVGLVGAVSYGITSFFIPFVNESFHHLFKYIFILLMAQIVFGFPNKHTANDNTSGVATLLCLMQSIPVEEREKVAFVFFDNEEIGLIGSSKFKKNHKKEMEDKLLINFDCVSDGGHFIFTCKKRAFNSDEYPLFKRIIEEEAPVFNKMPEFASVWQAFNPSDQIIFPKSIGVIALKKSPVLGLYLDRIHTSFDTRFDRNNISFLCSSFTKFITETGT